MKQFFLFIVLMRALAAIIITNAHYTGVYPTDLIANGGLLGDVLFFAVSGYCLASPRGGFGAWYLKRCTRVYVPVWMCTLAYMLTGAYVITQPLDVAAFFLWPTQWHFVASIMILYVPLFFVAKHVEMTPGNYGRLAGGLLVLQLMVYLLLYDRSYYHIDVVREPMIEFLFFQAMLMGLHFRWLCQRSQPGNSVIGGGITIYGAIVTFVLAGAYFASKMLLVKLPALAEFQIANQWILLSLLYVLFRLFMRTEDWMRRMKDTKVWRVVQYLADRTLEIYLVQYVILGCMKLGPFPLNWLLLTGSILLAATALRWGSQAVIRRIPWT